MITTLLFSIWFVAFFISLIMFIEEKTGSPVYVVLAQVLFALALLTMFTGVHIPSSHGEYTGYVTAVEQNGAVFKGWNVYLKTELESSNEDVACIDRNNQALIEELKLAQRNKENVTVTYEGVWQYSIGECPGTKWMVTKIN